KFRQTRKGATPVPKKKRSRAWIFAVGLVLVTAVIAAVAFFLSRRSAPVTTDRQAIQSSTATEGPPGGASAPAPEKSVAVLRFDNLSDEKQNAFFTDGVQDEILTDLAKIADLKVISRSSVMQYKSGVARDLRKIGQELGVAHLLEGSVQRATNKVRVN